MEQFLPFERPIEIAEQKLKRLAWRLRQGNRQIAMQYCSTYQHIQELYNKQKQSLTAFERVQLARHRNRPGGHAAASFLFGPLQPLRGDHSLTDDPALVVALGQWRRKTILVIACERGQTKQQARACNFGMPGPMGFRKVIRALLLADRYHWPVVTLVNTPGADPSVESERYGIAQAIGQTMLTFANMNVPVLSVVTGEGGSGGALALAMGNRLLMMENAYFSVISPEACASILWRDHAQTELAASSLHLLPQNLKDFGFIDDIVNEPLEGAHHKPMEALCLLKKAIDDHLNALLTTPSTAQSDFFQVQRYQRYRQFGAFERLEQTQVN